MAKGTLKFVPKSTPSKVGATKGTLTFKKTVQPRITNPRRVA